MYYVLYSGVGKPFVSGFLKDLQAVAIIKKSNVMITVFLFVRFNLYITVFKKKTHGGFLIVSFGSICGRKH